MAIRSVRDNIFIAFFCVCIFGPLLWLILDREPPFILTGGVTVPNEIKRGGEFKIEWEFHDLPKVCPGTVYGYSVDSKGKIWVEAPAPAVFGLIQAEDENTVPVSGRTHKVPMAMALGPAKIHLIIDFICNFTNYLKPIRIFLPIVNTTIIE